MSDNVSKKSSVVSKQHYNPLGRVTGKVAMPFFQELIQKIGSEEAAFRAMTESSPPGRFAEPEEIAPAILYLASDESLFVTGTDLVVDAGYSI